jgi:glutathione synthase/RimK-type ligase-like ATP-grasp enzyme
MKPRVLLVAFEDWYSTARLPAALSDAGFEVGVLSEPDNFAAQSRHVARRFPLDFAHVRRGRLDSVIAAIGAFAPDLLMPGDERASRVVKSLQDAPALQQLVKRSVGEVGWARHAGERSRMLDLVAGLGFAVPAHASVRRAREVTSFAERHGWPVYLKRDHTYGGQGVRLCADAATATAAYGEFTRGHVLWSPLGLWRRGRRLLQSFRPGRDPLALPIGAQGTSVEATIAGQPAFYTGVAFEGRLLDGFAAEVEAFHPPPAGPSTRVRLHHDQEMDGLAGRLVAALGHSGFVGLDFIRRPSGGLVFLEFNGRPTTVSHLGGLVGADLGAALFAVVAGRALLPSSRSAEVRVALFPQDWIRDPHAGDRAAFHVDIPRADPPIIAALSRRLPPSVDRAEIEVLSRDQSAAKES